MDSLYYIATRYSEALDALEIDEETGELLNADQLDAAAADFDAKVESTALYIKNLVALEDALANEAKMLTERRDAASKKIAACKRYLALCFEIAGKDRYESPKCAVTTRTSKYAEITDESAIPPLWWKERTTRSVDKAGILAALKQGEAISGAEMRERKNIQIK